MAKTYFFWDSDNLLQEYDQAGATIAHYVTEPDQYGNVLSQRRAGTTHVFHHDAIGSTTELTNESGLVTDTRRNTAFGETTDETGNTVFPYQFIGQIGYYLEVPTEAVTVRRRVLNVALGRWLSADPRFSGFDPPREAIEPTTPSAHHLYRYVDNSPINLVDPSGLDFWEESCRAACYVNYGKDAKTADPAVFAACWQLCLEARRIAKSQGISACKYLKNLFYTGKKEPHPCSVDSWKVIIKAIVDRCCGGII